MTACEKWFSTQTSLACAHLVLFPLLGCPAIWIVCSPPLIGLDPFRLDPPLLELLSLYSHPCIVACLHQPLPPLLLDLLFCELVIRHFHQRERRRSFWFQGDVVL